MWLTTLGFSARLIVAVTGSSGCTRNTTLGGKDGIPACMKWDSLASFGLHCPACPCLLTLLGCTAGAMPSAIVGTALLCQTPWLMLQWLFMYCVR